MTILFLIRHGETDWNKQGKYTGQKDIPINATGIEQAVKVSKKLKIHAPEIIYSSNLLRALQTAEEISKELKIPIIKDDRLQEINQGEWEGLHITEIQQRYSNEFADRNEDPLRVAAPGGESIGEVEDRVKSFLKEITAKHPQSRIALTSHGIVLGIIRTITKGFPISEVFNNIPKNAELIRVKIEI